MNWQQRPQHYGAILFHGDDVYDAGWEVDFELIVPAALKSGLYAAHLWSGNDEEYIPFAIHPLPGKEKKIAFLLPTASYMAYANDHMAFNAAGLIEVLSGRLSAVQRRHPYHRLAGSYGS